MVEQTVKDKPHLTQVDYVRAIASLMVALFHLGGKTLPVLKYGWLGVEMFFVLSGFIICWSIPISYTWKMSGRFISKRVIRIEPPYILSVGLVLVSHYLLIANYHPNWENVLFHFAYINNFVHQDYLNPVYWTLGIEFQFYLLIALLFPFFLKNWGPFLILALCIIPFFITIPATTLFGFFPAFALGILYYLFQKKYVNITKALLFGIAFSICFYYEMGFLPLCAGLFTIVVLILPLKSNRMVSFFSKISFSLYLTHDIVGSSFVVHAGMLLPKTFLFKGLEFLCGILISVLFAYLFYLCVERPCLKYSKRILYSKN